MLIRRQIDPEPGQDPEPAFYRCAGPAATPVPELIRVAATLVLAPATCMAATLDWSNWRRRRQHQARICHYRRRGHRPP